MANRFFQTVSQTGRKFFRNEQTGACGYFELDPSSRVWFHDTISQRKIHLHARHPIEGLSGGHHQAALVRAMRGFIILGQRLNPDFFRPHLSGREHPWGYGEAIELVCSAGQSIGVIAPTIIKFDSASA